MSDAARLVGLCVGIVVVLATWKSIFYTFVMTRDVRNLIARANWDLNRRVFMAVANRLPDYERKDRWLIGLGPAALVSMLVTWLALFICGFALVFWGLIDDGFAHALKLSGSSFFTLGVVSSPHGGPTAVEFLAAGTGMIVIAIIIGYIPTFYAAYNRRETLVVALAARIGSPAWGPEILARHELSRARDTLPALFGSWETWAADISESHVTHPWLVGFRSTDPLQNWVVSLMAVLDAAALWVSLAPESAAAEARQCLRSGTVALGTVAAIANRPAQPEQDLDAPTRLRQPAFARAVDIIRETGFPIELSTDEAWDRFRRWRVQYEAAGIALADYVVAPPAPWSGRRSALTADESDEVLRSRPAFLVPEPPPETAKVTPGDRR